MTGLLFNENDRKLLEVLNLLQTKDPALKNYDIILSSHMHPRGIKELVDQKVVRVAKTLFHFIDTLDEGKVDERLSALHSIRDEVFFSAKSTMNKNTARVLLSIMKELVREKDENRKLKLSHDFHSVLTGKPAIVRKFLKHYHLLEMPEEWNQITFDHHVHDAYTKGRKSPSHLIMDAWIKGIRDLKVIYYDFIPLEAARELLTAADYLNIKIRIGVDFQTTYREKKVNIIWTPRGFKGTNHFIKFLKKESTSNFFKKGKEAKEYREHLILAKFDYFNTYQREQINSKYKLSLPVLKEEGLRKIVGNGQLSLLHVSEYLHTKISEEITLKINQFRKEYNEAEKNRKKEIDSYLENANKLSSEFLFKTYLKEIDDKVNISIKKPEVLNLSPKELIENLEKFHSSFRITLSLNTLKIEDVIELVYQNDGKINNLEIFNYKDFAKGLSKNIPKIREFQHAVNEGNTIKLKRIIFSVLSKLEKSDLADKDTRIENMKLILKNLSTFIFMYKDKALKDKIGSDSAGRSNQLFGMGFAITNTLPQSAQKEINKIKKKNQIIMPLFINTTKSQIYEPLYVKRDLQSKFRFWISKFIPLVIFNKVRTKWDAGEYSYNEKSINNVVALGARPKIEGNEFSITKDTNDDAKISTGWKYLNTGLKNTLKILLGFIPAFFTFYFTKEWWVLAYLGAPIWFTITGLRNILQSIIGGDSLKRSSLLNWKDYINWDRISDSLLYTGFSVPLLDFIVKQLILNNGFNINTSTNVLALYTFMALVNGVYISSHNFFRGLPPAAIFGNFFRSILSIPIAILFNAVIGQFLMALGVSAVSVILQKWAAVISKAASDTVAGVIEGSADRNMNIRLRYQDYKRKIDKMYETYIKMDLLLPDKDILHALKDPKAIIQTIKLQDPQLLPLLIYDALDFLYFWMYQPHARTVLKKILKTMTAEEKIIFIRFQYVLRRKQQITEMFADGLVGKNFSAALSFYLSKSESYLRALSKLVA